MKERTYIAIDLKSFYASRNKLRLVEGNQPIEDAYHDILRALGETV